MSPSAIDLDPIDRDILDLLVADGRRTVTEIAGQVGLSPAPVARRIARLEETGVITGYTAVVDHSKLGAGFEAFTEIRFSGSTEIASIWATAEALPEVLEVFTIAGDPDVLVRLRLQSMDQLQHVVDRFRREGGVLGTKTLIVLGAARRRGGSWEAKLPGRRARPTGDQA